MFEYLVPIGGAVWACLEGIALLEKGCCWGQAGGLKATHSAHSLSASY